MLPYSNQQVGGTLGGPIVKDKMHYFASYEYERQPGTIFSAPAGLSGQTFTFPTKTTQKSLLARVDTVLSNKDSLSIRGSRWDWNNPFNLGGGSYPSTANVLEPVRDERPRHLVEGHQQQHGAAGPRGYDDFFFGQTPLDSVVGTPEFDFPGLTIGAPYNLPSVEWQRIFESALRAEPPPGHARFQARRRVPPRRPHRLLAHPEERRLHR